MCKMKCGGTPKEYVLRTRQILNRDEIPLPFLVKKGYNSQRVIFEKENAYVSNTINRRIP